MTYRLHVKFVALFLVMILMVTTSPTRSVGSDLEWKVEVGDSMTYQITKYFASNDSDGNGDLNSTWVEITDENEKQVNITWKTGTQIKYVITELNNHAKVKITYDGEITTKEETVAMIIIKTIDNRTYLETSIEEQNDSNMSLEGDELVTWSQEETADCTNHIMRKWNWRTGWLTYFSSRTFNDTQVTYVLELSVNPPSTPSGFDLGFFLFGLTVLTILVTRKRKKNDIRVR